jgi:hypothetical protein
MFNFPSPLISKHIFKLFRFIAIQQQHLYYFFVLSDKEHQLFLAAGFSLLQFLTCILPLLLPTSVLRNANVLKELEI